MSKGRRKHHPAFKAKVALDAVKGQVKWMRLVRQEEHPLMEINYRLDFIEGFRGQSDISGSVYSGKGPNVGWTWQLTQYHLVRDDEEDTLSTNDTVALTSSSSVFPDITQARGKRRASSPYIGT